MFRQSLKKKQSLAEHSFTIFYLTFCNTTVIDRAYWRHTLNTPTQGYDQGVDARRA